MPFEFTPYRNPYVGTIAELMGVGGQARAHALQVAGNAQAAATQASGNAWAGAAQNIGQIIGAVPQEIAQQQRQQTADDMNKLKLSEAQRDVAGQHAVAGMMAGDQLPAGAAGPRQESFLDQDGLFDIKKITTALGSAGYGDKASELVSGAEKINDSILKHQQLEQQVASAHTVMLGDLADGTLKLAKTGMPLLDAMDFTVQPAIATKRIDAREYAQVRQQIEQLPPEQQAAALSGLMDQAAKLDKGETLAEGAQRVDRYGRVLATGAPKPKTQAELAADAANPNSPTQKQSGDALAKLHPAPHDPLDEPITVKTVENGKNVEKVMTKRDAIAAGVFPSQPTAAQVAINTGGSLSDAATDQAAQKYLATGQLPPMGTGTAAAQSRARIMNRAAELDPEAALSLNAATYKADQGSLVSLQKQRDAIGSFENTAKKNIDLFLEQAGKVVDTGSPLANSLARTVSGKILGSPDPPTYDAARQVAINEIAKITSNPTLAGQLSDSARHEVETFNPANATLAQTVSVMRLLTKDMENRKQSVDDAIAEIKGRLGSNPSAQRPAAGGAPKSDPLGLFTK